jgi:hypothetical protein
MNALLRCTLAFTAGILWRHLFPGFNAGGEIAAVGLVGVLFLFVFFVLRSGNRYRLGSLIFLLFAVLGWIRTPVLEPAPGIDRITAYEAVVSSPPKLALNHIKLKQ